MDRGHGIRPVRLARTRVRKLRKKFPLGFGNSQQKARLTWAGNFAPGSLVPWNAQRAVAGDHVIDQLLRY
jgi:hypothetical protein